MIGFVVKYVSIIDLYFVALIKSNTEKRRGSNGLIRNSEVKSGRTRRGIL